MTTATSVRLGWARPWTARKIVAYRRPLIVLGHALLFLVAYALAFALRFDFHVPPSEYRNFVLGLPWSVGVQLGTLAVFRLYEGLWRYVGVRDVVELVKAGAIALIVGAIGIRVLIGPAFPRSVIILNALLAVGFAGTVRIFARLMLERSEANGAAALNGHRKRVLVAGAGDLAEALLREISRGKLPYRVVGLIEDDVRWRGSRLHGVSVLGRIEDLPVVAAGVKPDLVLIATSDVHEKRRIAKACLDLGLEVKGVPSVRDLLEGRAFIEHLRDVRLDDLLGRATNGSRSKELLQHLRGRRVLITGAAGSIGSEIARQVAEHEAALIVLVDRSESELYFTALDIRERFPERRVEALVGDITDEPFVRRLMTRLSPELVYHAAAYKHVPLMEDQPLEAIENNVFGTEVVAQAAAHAGVDRFVNISTDKAVQPVSVMGMTKRVAESLLAGLAGETTTFVSVRFGNVLGSHGSVLPLFHRQVARGSPLTITDPDATRYFMLVSEAVELVLQAGRLGRDGDTYVLDMGAPVRIGDLAENVIRLAGLEPHIDVPIEVVGLRPGERLHENAGVGPGEVTTRSEHDQIFVVHGPPRDAAFDTELNDLRERLIAGDGAGAVAVLRHLVRSDEPCRTMDVPTSAVYDD